MCCLLPSWEGQVTVAVVTTPPSLFGTGVFT